MNIRPRRFALLLMVIAALAITAVILLMRLGAPFWLAVILTVVLTAGTTTCWSSTPGVRGARR